MVPVGPSVESQDLLRWFIAAVAVVAVAAVGWRNRESHAPTMVL